MPRSKKKIVGVFLLIFVILLSIGSSVGGSDSEETPNKQQKTSCFFGIHRFGKYERESRTLSTAVSINCGGEPIKLGTLVQRPGHEMELHGSFSKPDLLLTRGGAIYMKDPSELEKWKDEYICSQHVKELLSEWKTFAYKHLHNGSAICFQHHKEMMATIDEYYEKNVDFNFEDSLQVCTVSKPDECSREEMQARKFFEFAKIVGISRLIPRKEYSEYKKDTQRKKVDGVLAVQEWTIHYVAPGHEPELKASVNARCSRGYASEAEASIDGVMKMIGYAYLMARTPRQRDYVLALVAGRYPYHVVARYVPSLSKSKFYRAEIIANPHVMESNPIGTRDVKLSTGEVIQIPNTIRLMGHAEIIRQFGQFMKENDMENHLESDSSIHRVLRGIPADQRC